MATASDKARFYMEQTLPELREYSEKKIFTKVRTASYLCFMFPKARSKLNVWN